MVRPPFLSLIDMIDIFAVDAIIFLAPISGFDQVLSEDKTVNRLVSSFFLVALILRLCWRLVRLVDLFDDLIVAVCSSLAPPFISVTFAVDAVLLLSFPSLRLPFGSFGYPMMPSPPLFSVVPPLLVPLPSLFL